MKKELTVKTLGPILRFIGCRQWFEAVSSKGRIYGPKDPGKMPEVKATPSLDFLLILGIFNWPSSGG